VCVEESGDAFRTRKKSEAGLEGYPTSSGVLLKRGELLRGKKGTRIDEG